MLAGACFLFVGARTKLLIRYIRDPIVLAFSTASSEAAYPRTLEALERFGVPPRIASFVLPLGYSFNLDGSMMYMTYRDDLHRAGLWHRPHASARKSPCCW